MAPGRGHILSQIKNSQYLPPKGGSLSLACRQPNARIGRETPATRGALTSPFLAPHGCENVNAFELRMQVWRHETTHPTINLPKGECL